MEKIIDFQYIKTKTSPNQGLGYWEDLNGKHPDILVPTYNVSVIELYKSWCKLIAGEKRMICLAKDMEHLKFIYEKRSLIFHFPDRIHIQFFERGPSQSTLGLYSYARFGYYDFGVNQRRVKRWIHEINRNIHN